MIATPPGGPTLLHGSAGWCWQSDRVGGPPLSLTLDAAVPFKALAACAPLVRRETGKE